MPGQELFAQWLHGPSATEQRAARARTCLLLVAPTALLPPAVRLGAHLPGVVVRAHGQVVLRDLRALGVRTAAELKERWRALKHVTLSSRRIGDLGLDLGPVPGSDHWFWD
jgi:hypothetical protein